MGGGSFGHVAKFAVGHGARFIDAKGYRRGPKEWVL